MSIILQTSCKYRNREPAPMKAIIDSPHDTFLARLFGSYIRTFWLSQKMIAVLHPSLISGQKSGDSVSCEKESGFSSLQLPLRPCPGHISRTNIVLLGALFLFALRRRSQKGWFPKNDDRTIKILPKVCTADLHHGFTQEEVSVYADCKVYFCKYIVDTISRFKLH